MSNNQTLLRQIPKVDELLACAPVQALAGAIPHTVTMQAIRTVLDGLRGEILHGGRTALPGLDDIAAQVAAEARRQTQPSLRRVINATGVVLHTNLGRARLCPAAARAAMEVAEGYSTLEYNTETGSRGSRYDHVEKLLCTLTGAESAMVVNNNAAAVMLVLSTMVKGREAIVSRGELVEIGGSFRVPEIMEQSGGILREVGTTNKTHLRDYADAIDPEKTGALLKVHTSNYRILGFTESVSLEEMVALGRERGVPVLHDLGSGAMIDFDEYGLPGEPGVLASVRAGADVVSFSGDKLLGGPQAGIIVGKKEYIDRMKRNPLTRAFRVDKMTLAALEATLAVYRDEEKAKQEIPTLQMLLLSREELQHRAGQLCALIGAALPQLAPETLPQTEQVGGGSMPGRELPGWAVQLAPPHCSVDRFEEKLRHGEVPLIARIAHDRVLLDVRTIQPEEFGLVVELLRAALN